ncbi:hypothetical protein [Flavobacterium sp. DSR2-3-3]|uniref:hypothetical protein n=1 Tax=Flavobacterium sp. DSR2-3-3 TaxID=2804632 RepID=UPI003CEAC811
MNVIEIQNLINQIGNLEIKFNENKQECLVNGENIFKINKNIFEVIRDEYRQKLTTQLNQKSDSNLLVVFLDEISNFIQNLNSSYHSYRIKLSESKYKNINCELGKIFIKICQIIDFKIGILEEMKNDLETKLKYFEYKLESDFNQDHLQNSSRIEIEEVELDLKGLPKLNVSERYKLLKLLNIVEIFKNLEIEKKSKFKLLALTMGISLDNARHLLSDSYKITSESENKSLDNFLAKENIKL